MFRVSVLRMGLLRLVRVVERQDTRIFGRRAEVLIPVYQTLVQVLTMLQLQILMDVLLRLR